MIDLLEDSDASALKALITTIREKTDEYDKIITSKDSTMQKWKRGQASENKEKGIKEVLTAEGSRMMILYRIFEQTTDVVPTLVRLKISFEASAQVDALRRQGTITDKLELRKIKSKFKRRALRETLRSIKAHQIERWKKNDFDELLPKV